MPLNWKRAAKHLRASLKDTERQREFLSRAWTGCNQHYCEVLKERDSWEAKYRREVMRNLSIEGQCAEEHHWVGNCPVREANQHIEALQAQLRSQKINATCNCAPNDGWTLDCGLPGVCKCRCHALETRLAEHDGCPTVAEWRALVQAEGEVRAERDVLLGKLCSATINATCNCTPDGWHIECGLTCGCRCHDLEARVYAAEATVKEENAWSQQLIDAEKARADAAEFRADNLLAKVDSMRAQRDSARDSLGPLAAERDALGGQLAACRAMVAELSIAVHDAIAYDLGEESREEHMLLVGRANALRESTAQAAAEWTERIRADERERCATVADGARVAHGCGVANAIRALGPKPAPEET